MIYSSNVRLKTFLFLFFSPFISSYTFCCTESFKMSSFSLPFANSFLGFAWFPSAFCFFVVFFFKQLHECHKYNFYIRRIAGVNGVSVLRLFLLLCCPSSQALHWKNAFLLGSLRYLYVCMHRFPSWGSQHGLKAARKDL